MSNLSIDIPKVVQYLYRDSSRKCMIEQLIDADITFSVYGSSLRAGIEESIDCVSSTKPNDLDIFIEIDNLSHVEKIIRKIEREFYYGGYNFKFSAKMPHYTVDDFDTYEYLVEGKKVHLAFGPTIPISKQTLDADVNALYLKKKGCVPGWQLEASAGHNLAEVVEHIRDRQFIPGPWQNYVRKQKLLDAGYAQIKEVDLPDDVIEEIKNTSFGMTRITHLSPAALELFKTEYKKILHTSRYVLLSRSVGFIKSISDIINWDNNSILLPGNTFEELFDYPHNMGKAFFSDAPNYLTRRDFYEQLKRTLPKITNYNIENIIDNLNEGYFNDARFLEVFVPALTAAQINKLINRIGFSRHYLLDGTILLSGNVLEKLLSLDIEWTDTQANWIINLIKDDGNFNLSSVMCTLKNFPYRSLKRLDDVNKALGNSTATAIEIFSKNKEAIAIREYVKQVFANNKIYFRSKDKLYDEVEQWGVAGADIRDSDGSISYVSYDELYNLIKENTEHSTDFTNNNPYLHSSTGPARVIYTANRATSEFWLAGNKVAESEFIKYLTERPTVWNTDEASMCRASSGAMHNLAGPAVVYHNSDRPDEFYIAGRILSYAKFNKFTAGISEKPEPIEKVKTKKENNLKVKQKEAKIYGLYTTKQKTTGLGAKHLLVGGSVIFTEVSYYQHEEKEHIIALVKRASVDNQLGIASKANNYKSLNDIRDFTETEIVLYNVEEPIDPEMLFNPNKNIFDIEEIDEAKGNLHWRFSSFDGVLCAPTCSNVSVNNLHDSLIKHGYHPISPHFKGKEADSKVEAEDVSVITEETTMSDDTKTDDTQTDETTETTERPDFFTMAKRDMNEAQYRLIRSKLLDAAKSVFLAILAKDESNSPHLESVKKVLESKGGEAFLSGALGYSLTFVPGEFLQDPRIQAMAEEFRVNGIHKAEEQVFDIVMDAVTPTIMQTLNDSLANLPVLEEVSAPAVETKADVQKQAELEAQAEAEMEAEDEALSGQRSSIAP